jgi:TrmH family RNA methyltransferase
VIEGYKSLTDAVARGASVDAVYVDPAAATDVELGAVRDAASIGAAVFEVHPGVLTRACDTVTPQPVAATVRKLDVTIAELARCRPSLVVVLAGVRDPGNAGSIIRTAAAAGSAAVVLCEGSVDVYNPKTVRAAAGGIFSLPVVVGAVEDEIAGQLRNLGLQVFATASKAGRAHTDTDLSGPVAVILGNEARGLADTVSRTADGVLTIPVAEGTDSLGVAAAAAIICFESSRQRRLSRVAGAA